MISPCQEGKSSPDALRRSACIKFLGASARVRTSRRGSCSVENQTSICCLSPEGRAQKIEFVISCQSRNNRWGPRELTLCRPVGYRRALAGCALKKSSCISHPLRSGAVFVFYYQKAFLPAINRHQVRHHLPRHGQCCAVGIAFLFFLFVYHRQFGAVSRRHLCPLNQTRWQEFVSLFREWRALGDIGRTSLRAAQSAVADGL